MGTNEWSRCTEKSIKIRQYTVKEIREGADYRLRVTAVNIAGEGPPGQTEPVTVSEPQGTVIILILNGALCQLQVRHFSPIKIMHYSNFSAEPPNVELDVSVKNGIQILAGKTLRIPATVTGRPTPTIVWTLEEGALDKDRVVIENIGTKSELIIQNALRKDHGRYVITATNESGSKFAATRVDIFGKKYML